MSFEWTHKNVSLVVWNTAQNPKLNLSDAPTGQKEIKHDFFPQYFLSRDVSRWWKYIKLTRIKQSTLLSTTVDTVGIPSLLLISVDELKCPSNSTFGVHSVIGLLQFLLLRGSQSKQKKPKQKHVNSMGWCDLLSDKRNLSI